MIDSLHFLISLIFYFSKFIPNRHVLGFDGFFLEPVFKSHSLLFHSLMLAYPEGRPRSIPVNFFSILGF